MLTGSVLYSTAAMYITATKTVPAQIQSQSFHLFLVAEKISSAADTVMYTSAR